MSDSGGMSKYEQHGVDTDKSGVAAAFSAVEAELFPHAFCAIYRKPGEPGRIYSHQTDGVGSKSILRYLLFRETGDSSVFEGDVDDCIEMNFGDLMCAGVMPMSFVDYIAINKFAVPKDKYIAAINAGLEKTRALLHEWGIDFNMSGGETADLPDQERTYDFTGAVYGEANDGDVITCERIEPGDVIVGVRSGGQAKWEDKTNSGLMSNGFTLARHVLIPIRLVEKYPEIAHDASLYGEGTSVMELDENMLSLDITLNEALVSPTRHFSIIINGLLQEFRRNIHGMVFNTGGGHTKCLRVGENIRYVKDNLPVADSIFGIIQQSSGEAWKDMYQGYNMGVGLEVQTDEATGQRMVEYVRSAFEVDAQIMGHCERSDSGNEVVLRTREHGEFVYKAA